MLSSRVGRTEDGWAEEQWMVIGTDHERIGAYYFEMSVTPRGEHTVAIRLYKQVNFGWIVNVPPVVGGMESLAKSASALNTSRI